MQWIVVLNHTDAHEVIEVDFTAKILLNTLQSDSRIEFNKVVCQVLVERHHNVSILQLGSNFFLVGNVVHVRALEADGKVDSLLLFV
jgi:hypothetical protein